MAKHINIKTDKPELFGRAPLLIYDRHSDSAKALRYHKYQMLYYHHHPNLLKPQKMANNAIQQSPVAVENAFKPSRTKWFDIIPLRFVELFAREKSTQEILSSTA